MKHDMMLTQTAIVKDSFFSTHSKQIEDEEEDDGDDDDDDHHHHHHHHKQFSDKELKYSSESQFSPLTTHFNLLNRLHSIDTITLSLNYSH
jgi:hypothetical protein